ncbi:MAG: PKD domain-containing protein [Nocardioidaceae bacterium]
MQVACAAVLVLRPDRHARRELHRPQPLQRPARGRSGNHVHQLRHGQLGGDAPRRRLAGGAGAGDAGKRRHRAHHLRRGGAALRRRGGARNRRQHHRRHAVHPLLGAGRHRAAYGLDRLNGAAAATPLPLPPGPPPPPNQPPVALATVACPTLSCTFDGTASADPDGAVTDYQWEFGDGSTGSGSVATHDYALAGTYDYTLTVTDNSGATNQMNGSVTVSDPSSSTIRYVDSAGAALNTKSPSILVPAGGQVGDLLLLAIDLSSSVVPIAAPTGVSGWTSLGVADANGMKSQVWWKVGRAGDFGARVTVPLGSGVKSSLQVLDYSGVNPVKPIDAFASATGTTATATHTTPAVSASSGDWVVSLWSDKSSTTTGWITPSGVVTRNTQLGTGTWYATAVAADSGRGVGLGPNGGLTATTNQRGSRAVMWTIALDDAG